MIVECAWSLSYVGRIIQSLEEANRHLLKRVAVAIRLLRVKKLA